MGSCNKMLLFSAKIVLRESCDLELAHVKKETNIGSLSSFWFGFLPCFLVPLVVLLVMKALENEQHIAIIGLHFKRFCCIIIYCMSVLPQHMESTDSMDCY